jgi:hypothetical protein
MPRNVSYAKHAAEVSVSEKEKESFYISISFLGALLVLVLSLRLDQVESPYE